MCPKVVGRECAGADFSGADLRAVAERLQNTAWEGLCDGLLIPRFSLAISTEATI
jgi:hypothetical protein